jgi:hypothetical protein
MNLDVMVNAPQVVTVAVKALSYCRGLMSHPEISNFRMWIERIIK